MPEKLGHNSGHYQEDQIEILDGRVTLYRTRDSNLRWQYRIWVPESSKYVRRSAKTKNLDEAKRIAEDAYYDIRAKRNANIPVFERTYNQLLDDVFAKYEQEKSRGGLSEDRVRDLSNFARLYYRRYFGNMVITSITQRVIDDFWNYRFHFWAQDEHQALKREYKINRVSLNPARQTLQMEKRLIDDVFRHAVSNGYLMPHQVPDTKIPVLSKLSRRPALTEEQLDKMIEFLREYSDVYFKHVPKDHASYKENELLHRRAMLFPLVGVLLGTGMRYGAAKSLRWRDVYQSASENIVRFTASGKAPRGQKRRVYYPTAAWRVWSDYLVDWLEQTPYTKPEDFVFAGFDGEKHVYVDYQFRLMQAEAEKTKGQDMDYSGITEDTFGETLTIYSLRHTYATFQRRYRNRSYDALAQQMGTSAAMLKSYYDHVTPLEMSKEFAGKGDKDFAGKGELSFSPDEIKILRKMSKSYSSGERSTS